MSLNASKITLLFRKFTKVKVTISCSVKVGLLSETDIDINAYIVMFNSIGVKKFYVVKFIMYVSHCPVLSRGSMLK